MASYCSLLEIKTCVIVPLHGMYLKQSISGVPKIRDNYNPATWMLEVTSSSMESELGVDFGEIYSTSTLHA